MTLPGTARFIFKIQAEFLQKKKDEFLNTTVFISKTTRFSFQKRL